MTNTKKTVIAIICAICILSVGIGATVAFITSLAGPVNAVFVIGKIDLSFSETTGSSYKLVPGKVIAKDPTVTVGKGSESCWVFVKINESDNFDDYLTYAVADGWLPLGGQEGVYYREVAEAEAELVYPVLRDNSITVSDRLTAEKMSAITASPTLSFRAYAVQRLKVETAADAWRLITEEGAG